MEERGGYTGKYNILLCDPPKSLLGAMEDQLQRLIKNFVLYIII